MREAAVARYFVCVGDGPVVGPVRLDQLVRGLATKRLPTEALACLEGGEEWRPVAEIVDDVMTSDEKTLFAAPVVVEPPPKTNESSRRRATFDVVTCPSCKADTPVREAGKSSKCIQCGNAPTPAVKAPNQLSRVSTTRVSVTTTKGNPQVVDSRVVVAGGLVLTVLLVAGWFSTKGSSIDRPTTVPTKPVVTVVTTPPHPTCELMCDHAIGCVASRLGVAATGGIFQDARDNCIAGCWGAPQEKITCWTNARCDQIEKEQGLARKACPTP